MRRRSSVRSRVRAGARDAARSRGGRRSAPRSTRILALAILAILSLAALAPVGQASESLEAQVGRATRAAQRASERETVRLQRETERTARREAKRKSRESIRLAEKEEKFAIVKIECTRITVEYRGFNDVEGSPNTVVQSVLIKNPPPPLLPIAFPPIAFSFQGSGATSTIPIVAPVGHSLIDIRVKWNTNGLKGGFDMHGNVTCGPAPAFTIEKLQSLGGPFTTETLSGQVGQTVHYEMIVTNTGNTPLTFSEFSDPRCDPKTIAGISSNPVEPMGTLTLVCTHTLTGADREAGSLTNVATVKGTPEPGEGAPITHESNPVVVTPVAPGEKEEKEREEKEEREEREEEEREKEKPEEKHEETKPPPTPKQEVLSSTPTSSTPTTTNKSGVLGFASATVPSLRGPQGCVRGSFTASVKSAGVSSVTFYLDGHMLKRLTSRNSRKGLLSVRIDGSKLKVGAHRVLAKITMKQSSPTAKAAKASRALTIVRCQSAVITPHFTG